MAVLMIRCPHSGQELITGIEIDSESFADFPDAKAKTYCPHCGRPHAWWKKDAWLSEEKPSGQQATLAAN